MIDTTNWLASLHKGNTVIVRMKDSILSGQYRGNGTHWYTTGTVEHVSRQYGYLKVTFKGVWGQIYTSWLFHLDSGLSNNYWAGWDRDPKNASKITLKGSSEDYILFPNGEEYQAIIKRQQLLDVLTRMKWTDWECLTDEQIHTLLSSLFVQRKSDLSRWVKNDMWVHLADWEKKEVGPVCPERLAEWACAAFNGYDSFDNGELHIPGKFYELATQVIEEYTTRGGQYV